MNFVVSSGSLYESILVASRVVSSKNSLPILDNLLFKIENNNLSITGSDLETTIVTEMSLDSSNGDIIFAVETKKILDILKEFPEQPLNFNIDETMLSLDIVSNNGKYSLVAADPSDFPQVPILKGDRITRIELTPELLYKGITNTLFATGVDDLRPVINGIFVEFVNDHVNFVATDAQKLIRYTRRDISKTIEASFILPKKPANVLKNLITKIDGNILLEFDNKNAMFSFDKTLVVCRLAEGVYPKYSTVIPESSPYKLLVSKDALNSALRRVSLFSNQASNLVALSIQGNQLTITAQDIDYSTSGDETIICEYEGEAMQIGFKSNFMIEMLANVSSPNVVIELAEPGRAGIILPYEKENDYEDLLMLIMPMQVVG